MNKSPNQGRGYSELDHVQKRLIAGAPNPRDKAFISTLAKTGMRISEVIQLKESDIDRKRGTLTIVHLKQRLKLKCPNCGEILGKRHLFCPGCGNKAVLAVEIEKSNEKTIWFDLIKLMMLINGGIVQFGLVVAPRNYAHKTGVWRPFNRARFYKYCLYKYANVHIDLIKSIAIIGYTQEAKVSGSWTQLSKDVVIGIKKQAKEYFST